MIDRRIHLFALCGPFAIAGCATSPQYASPSSEVGSAYVAGSLVDARSAELPPVDLVRWWQAFDDPLLNSLVERAAAQNLDIAQARARVLQARARFRRAGADLRPSGTVSAQAGVTYQSLETPIGQVAGAFPGNDRTNGTYEAGAGLSWELDLFGGKDAARDAARADWEASNANDVAARLSVIAQTADTYVEIRELQHRLLVLREQIATQAQFTRLIDLQFRRGMAAELQLRQAEGALQQIRASEPDLQEALDEAMNALDVLLGEQPGATRTELAVLHPIPSAPAVFSAGGPTELMRRRPDIIAAERTLAASDARIGVAVAEYYPKISLGSLLGLASSSSGGLFGSDAVQGSGILGLRWRLFDFGRIEAEIDAAKGQNAEVLAIYRLTVLRATQDVENAFSSLVRQEARARSLAASEAALARARQSSQAAYDAGMVSLIEVLDADRRLLETRDGLIRAQAAASKGAIASFRALGGGWEGAT